MRLRCPIVFFLLVRVRYINYSQMSASVCMAGLKVITRCLLPHIIFLTLNVDTLKKVKLRATAAKSRFRSSHKLPSPGASTPLADARQLTAGWRPALPCKQQQWKQYQQKTTWHSVTNLTYSFLFSFVMVLLVGLNGIMAGLEKQKKQTKTTVKAQKKELFSVLSDAVVSENGLFALWSHCGWRTRDGLVSGSQLPWIYGSGCHSAVSANLLHNWKKWGKKNKIEAACESVNVSALFILQPRPRFTPTGAAAQHRPSVLRHLPM